MLECNHGLCWICRLFLPGWPLSQYQSYWPMSVGDLSIVQCLQSLHCPRFYKTSLSLICLDFSQDTFEAIKKGAAFLISFSASLSLVDKDFCLLLLYLADFDTFMRLGFLFACFFVRNVIWIFRKALLRVFPLCLTKVWELQNVILQQELAQIRSFQWPVLYVQEGRNAHRTKNLYVSHIIAVWTTKGFPGELGDIENIAFFITA